MKNLTIAALLVLLHACGGGGGDEPSDEGYEDDADIQFVLEVVEELGRLYEKNSGD